MAEKSYFKRYAGKLSDDSSTNYIQLFDAIGKQVVYDEALLKKLFARQKFIKQFSVAKTYLYKTIVKALKNYYEESGISFQLKNLQLELSLLIEKGLYSQAAKAIEKGLSLSGKFEMYFEQHEFLSAEFYLLMNNYQVQSKTRDINVVMEELKSVELKTETFFAYERLYRWQYRLNKMIYQLRDKGQLQEYNDIISNALLKDGVTNLSKRNQYYYHYIRALHFSVTDNRRLFLKEALQLKEVCRTSPYFYSYDFKSYMNSLNLLLEASHFNGDMKVMQDALKLLQGLQVQNERDKIAKFIYYSRFALIYYDAAGDTKAKRKLIDEAWSLLALYSAKIPFHIRVSIAITYISALLEMGDYSKAVDWIELYRRGEKEDKTRYDSQSILYILQLIAHYEIGNHLLVKNIVPNIARFIKRVGQQSKFERVLLSFFAKLTSSKTTAAKLFNDTLKELESLKEGDVLHRNRPMHDIFKVFIESKRAGMAYHKMVQSVS